MAIINLKTDIKDGKDILFDDVTIINNGFSLSEEAKKEEVAPAEVPVVEEPSIVVPEDTKVEVAPIVEEPVSLTPDININAEAPIPNVVPFPNIPVEPIATPEPSLPSFDFPTPEIPEENNMASFSKNEVADDLSNNVLQFPGMNMPETEVQGMGFTNETPLFEANANQNIFQNNYDTIYNNDVNYNTNHSSFDSNNSFDSGFNSYDNHQNNLNSQASTYEGLPINVQNAVNTVTDTVLGFAKENSDLKRENESYQDRIREMKSIIAELEGKIRNYEYKMQTQQNQVERMQNRVLDLFGMGGMSNSKSANIMRGNFDDDQISNNRNMAA